MKTHGKGSQVYSSPKFLCRVTHKDGRRTSTVSRFFEFQACHGVQGEPETAVYDPAHETARLVLEKSNG